MNSPPVSFTVLNWSAWAPGAASRAEWAAWAAGETLLEQDGQPALTFVEAMTRRRLSRLCRMSLHVAHETLGAHPPVRCVFSSRHGEKPRTVELLTALAHDEPLSPSGFSHSVHNSAVGLLSIIRADTSPSTALSAGRYSFSQALLEALAQLAENPAEPVLLLHADERLPAIYDAYRDEDDHSHALALLLGRGDSHQLAPARASIVSQEPESLRLLRGLLTNTPVTLGHAASPWIWSTR